MPSNQKIRSENIDIAIQNRSYFKDAMFWYEASYLLCNTHKVLIGFASCTILSIAFILFITANAIHKNTNNKIRLIEEERLAAGQHLSIKKLTDKIHDNPKEVLAKYMVGLYIRYKESLGVFEWNAQNAFLKENSSYQVYKRVVEAIQKRTESSIIKYVDVESVEIDHATLNNKAKVYAVVYIIDQGKVVQIKKLNIIMDFFMSELSAAYKGMVKFSFTVNEYKIDGKNA